MCCESLNVIDDML